MTNNSNENQSGNGKEQSHPEMSDSTQAGPKGLGDYLAEVLRQELEKLKPRDQAKVDKCKKDSPTVDDNQSESNTDEEQASSSEADSNGADGTEKACSGACEILDFRPSRPENFRPIIDDSWGDEGKGSEKPARNPWPKRGLRFDPLNPFGFGTDIT